MTLASLALYRRMRGIWWGLLVGGVIVLPSALVLALTVPARLGIFSDTTIDSIGPIQTTIASAMGLAGVLGLIASVVLGSTAGSVDLQRGVLRDLVLAGSHRWQVVGSRVLAAYVLMSGAVLVSGVLAVGLGYVTGGDSVDDIDWEELARGGAQFLPGMSYTLPFAAGVAMLVGSRGPAIAVYFVFSLLIDNILVGIPTVGEWWQHVSMSVADQQVVAAILGGESFGGSVVDRPTWQAVAVLAAWAIGALGAGLVRLTRRDL
jgi:ABC-type transport system involved in multi-copper enzyme maturation permease subunit